MLPRRLEGGRGRTESGCGWGGVTLGSGEGGGWTAGGATLGGGLVDEDAGGDITLGSGAGGGWMVGGVTFTGQ